MAPGASGSGGGPGGGGCGAGGGGAAAERRFPGRSGGGGAGRPGAEAVRLNEVLELGLEVAEQALTDLPWEALQVPGASGEVAEVGGSPLVLHRNVAVFRLISGLGTSPAHRVRGPLRLLVAIASPETPDAELLDYEAELARIVAAVSRPARGAKRMCGC